MELLRAVWICFLLLFRLKVLECSSVKHVSTATFEKFPNKKAIALPIETKEAKLESICHQSCLANPICQSLNIIVETAIKFICELFKIRLQFMETKLIASNNSDFYNVMIYADCQEALGNKVTSTGIAHLGLPSGKVVQGYCDMETAGGGWAVLQRRQDGSVDFDLPRKEYKAGFGDLLGEFWFGLEAMHEMTASAEYTIRFDLWNAADYRYAEYKNVRIGDEEEFYKLTIGSYSGNAGDDLTSNNQFTTKDLDRDMKASFNCAAGHRSGWWWKSCHPVSLNGYRKPGTCDWDGIVWKTFNSGCTLTKVEIKIRK